MPEWHDSAEFWKKKHVYRHDFVEGNSTKETGRLKAFSNKRNNLISQKTQN